MRNRLTRGNIPDWSLELEWEFIGSIRKLQKLEFSFKHKFTEVGIEWTSASGFGPTVGFQCDGFPFYDKNGYEFKLLVENLPLTSNTATDIEAYFMQIELGFEFKAGIFKTSTPKASLGDIIGWFD